jgi:hypothetical protein
MIMEIFVAQSQREDSLPDQLFHRMLDAPGITIVVKAESQALQKTNLLLHFTQQERPAIARDRTGIKAGHDLTTERRGKGKRVLDLNPAHLMPREARRRPGPQGIEYICRVSG